MFARVRADRQGESMLLSCPRKVIALVLVPACVLGGGIGFRSVRAQDGHAHQAGEANAWSKGDAFARALAAGMDKMHRDMMAARPTGNPDVDFLATMIPHHAGAVEMARLALIHGEIRWCAGSPKRSLRASRQRSPPWRRGSEDCARVPIPLRAAILRWAAREVPPNEASVRSRWLRERAPAPARSDPGLTCPACGSQMLHPPVDEQVAPQDGGSAAPSLSNCAGVARSTTAVEFEMLEVHQLKHTV
jgi:hypothetical protein